LILFAYFSQVICPITFNPHFHDGAHTFSWFDSESFKADISLIESEQQTPPPTNKIKNRQSRRTENKWAKRPAQWRTKMNKMIIALGIALVSATSAFADSSALDIINHPTFNSVSSVDLEATGSVGAVAFEDEFRFGDTSPVSQVLNPAVDNAATGSIAPVATTDYVTNDRLGGNS
jgi:hypothetical protein